MKPLFTSEKSQKRPAPKGASTVEYGILMVLMAVASLTVFFLSTDRLVTMFNNGRSTMTQTAEGGKGPQPVIPETPEPTEPEPEGPLLSLNQCALTANILPTDSTVANNLRGVTHSPFGFFAAGWDGTLLISPNGTQWNEVTTPGGTEHLWDIAASDSVVVAVGDNGTIWRTTDGTTWQAASQTPLTRTWRNVSYFEPHFFVTGFQGGVMRSEDGDVWTNISPPSTRAIRGAVVLNNRLITAGDEGRTWRSDSLGNDWISVAPRPQTQQIWDVGATNTHAIAVGNGGVIATSTNGQDWTVATPDPTLNFRSVITDGNTVVVLASNGTLMVSTDLENWTPRSLDNEDDVFAIATSPDQGVVIVGANGEALNTPCR